MTLREAAQQALTVLNDDVRRCNLLLLDKITKDLRAALAEPVQPVGTVVAIMAQPDGTVRSEIDCQLPLMSKVYTAPPPRKPHRTVTYVCPVCAVSLERQE